MRLGYKAAQREDFALDFIQKEGIGNPSALATHLDIKDAWAELVLHDLCEIGYVDRGESGAYYWLTDKGKDFLRKRHGV